MVSRLGIMPFRWSDVSVAISFGINRCYTPPDEYIYDEEGMFRWRDVSVAIQFGSDR